MRKFFLQNSAPEALMKLSPDDAKPTPFIPASSARPAISTRRDISQTEGGSPAWFDDGASTKPTHGLRCRIGFALLRCIESSADVAADLARKLAQVPSTRTHPDDRALGCHDTYIRLYV